MKKVTMQDIANKLGVSKMTISKYFQDNNDISDEMKEKIKITAGEMGYLYQKQKRYHVSVLISEVFLETTEKFYSDIYLRLNELSGLNNLALSLVVVKKSDEIEGNFVHNFNKQDAIIILGQMSKAFVTELLKYNIPKVCMDFYYRDLNLDTVISNSFNASYNLTSYLIEKGHNKIAFIGTLNSTSSINDRFLGYYKALLEAGIELNKEYWIEDRNKKGEMIDISLPDDMPTAFVCNNDHIAYILITKLKKENYLIPRDISVVGFDDILYSTICEPQITTMRVPRKYMAEQAIKLLLRRIKNPTADIRNINIECKMIERESVKRRISIV